MNLWPEIDPIEIMSPAITHPVQFPDEPTSTARPVRKSAPNLAPGVAVSVLVDGRWLPAEVVGVSFSTVYLRRTENLTSER